MFWKANFIQRHNPFCLVFLSLWIMCLNSVKFHKTGWTPLANWPWNGKNKTIGSNGGAMSCYSRSEVTYLILRSWLVWYVYDNQYIFFLMRFWRANSPRWPTGTTQMIPMRWITTDMYQPTVRLWKKLLKIWLLRHVFVKPYVVMWCFVLIRKK